jgi:hypothetical protein
MLITIHWLCLMLLGVKKVGTTGTAGVGQTHAGWTKRDLDERIIGSKYG